MSGEQLRIGSWVLIRDDCHMYRMVNGSDEVEFTFGSGSSVFDFVFTAKALRRFVGDGLEALREMDEIREKDPPN